MNATRYEVRETRPQAPEMGETLLRKSKTFAAAKAFAVTWQKKYPKHQIRIVEVSK